ncbi:MAG TPA: hypothetical protein VFG30_30695 [Polyangiales bacterium]|jgi:hypothetical protein|nr:hypothetical protein [Polyangiales bacterium]
MVEGYPSEYSLTITGVQRMRSKKLIGAAGVFAWLAAWSLVSAVPAEAGSMKASVFITQAKIPTGLSEKALIGFAKTNHQKLLHETTTDPVKERKWLATMVISFSKPVDDMEFSVLFYDVHDGPRRFVDDMSTMVNKRNEKTYVQKVTLDRPKFKPNRNMELVVTVRREEVGRLKFGVLGEEIKRSGQVSFSDDETGAKKK